MVLWAGGVVEYSGVYRGLAPGTAECENCNEIPKADGDCTSLVQRPLCVLPVVYRLWASPRFTHLKDWVEGWVPESVFSLGNGVSSVEAWFSTALDIEEDLFGSSDDQLHVLVDDVIESSDTVDRSILD